MTLKRMDNVLIVVDDLEAAKAFFIELGLKLEGETTVEGPLIGRLIGLNDVRATIAMMRTPDGQGIELDKFHTPVSPVILEKDFWVCWLFGILFESPIAGQHERGKRFQHRAACTDA